MSNLWQRFVILINNNFCGFNSCVTRKFIMEQLNMPVSKPNTVDTYRSSATAAGYLSTCKRGVYKIMKPIPTSLSMRDIKRMSYPKVEGTPNEN